MINAFFSIIIIIVIIIILPSAQAAESTPSADIKAKLEQLKQEIASKAAVLKKEITKKLENKAFVGVVKIKSDHSITLATKQGTKIASVTEDTVYQDDTKKQKKLSLILIKEEDNLAALGDIDDTGVLVAKKIVLVPPPTSNPKTILWGQILSVSEKLITIRNRESKNITLSVGKDIDIQKNSKVASLKDLGDSDYVITTGFFDEKSSKVGILDTGFIYILTPQGAVKPKEATSSATPISSTKPTTKPTAKPKSFN